MSSSNRFHPIEQNLLTLGGSQPTAGASARLGGSPPGSSDCVFPLTAKRTVSLTWPSFRHSRSVRHTSTTDR